MTHLLARHELEVRHFHLFAGLGGGAKGFNRGQARVGNLSARFRILGGVDVNRGAMIDFEKLTGAKGTVMDLFDRAQYIAFHGHEPPPDWHEVTPADIRRAAGNERPHIVFTSPPCKGLTGLLSDGMASTPKYQALNRLTVRGIWLTLEAWADNPVEMILMENVPRIATRGRPLLDIIVKMLKAYGYAVAETTHDCGVLGNLGQSRKRFLLVARHAAKVPHVLYQPRHGRLRSVGEVLDKLPLPGDPAAGIMHRLPQLQWKTWLRLAFVKAGGDWRSLNDLRVENGTLADFAIQPITSQTLTPPQLVGGLTNFDANRRTIYGVVDWDNHSGVVTGNARPMTGAFSVADPRPASQPHGFNENVFRVVPLTANNSPSSAGQPVADPRYTATGEYGQYGVRDWTETSGAISGQTAVGGGRYAVADPRTNIHANGHQNLYRVQDYTRHTTALTGANHISGGAMAVADPRCNWNPGAHASKLRVVSYDKTSPTIAGSSTAGHGYTSGALSLADPRINPALLSEVSDADGTTQARDSASTASPISLPAPGDRLTAQIISLDGTWHRPFTTLECATLQGIVDPDEHLELEGMSDAAWRERIGNAVPPPAAQAIASIMGRTLLLAWSGQTYTLGKEHIWVQPFIAALAGSRLDEDLFVG